MSDPMRIVADWAIERRVFDLTMLRKKLAAHRMILTDRVLVELQKRIVRDGFCVVESQGWFHVLPQRDEE